MDGRNAKRRKTNTATTRPVRTNASSPSGASSDSGVQLSPTAASPTEIMAFKNELLEDGKGTFWMLGRRCGFTVHTTATSAQVASLEDPCEDLEGRSRRSNIRIVDVLEGQGSYSSTAVSVLLEEAFQFEKAPLLNRVH